MPIVKVEIKGAYVRIRSEDESIKVTTALTAPLVARMNGRAKAFFHATAERGGGSDKEGRRYENPSVIVDIGEAAPEQAW